MTWSPHGNNVWTTPRSARLVMLHEQGDPGTIERTGTLTSTLIFSEHVCSFPGATR